MYICYKSNDTKHTLLYMYIYKNITMNERRSRTRNLKYVLLITESPEQNQPLVIYNAINIFVYY